MTRTGKYSCTMVEARASFAMKLAEIKRAISEGQRVCWQNSSYEVIADSAGSDYYIKCLPTGHCIRLVQSDGLTLNATETEFYVAKNKSS